MGRAWRLLLAALLALSYASPPAVKLDAEPLQAADAGRPSTSGDSGCCAEVAVLTARVDSLEQLVASLNDTVSRALSAHRAEAQTTAEREAVTGNASRTPDYYKLKDKAPERRWLSVKSWLCVSFEVYSGDLYLGEFRQSMPWIRVFWDDILFFGPTGEFQGQLYFGLVRWILGFVPNPFVGDAKVYLELADGTTPLVGNRESLFWALISAERRSLDFVWTPSQVRFKSRKTSEARGQQEWIMQEASGRGKVAEIKESVVHDVWGRQFRGWTVSIVSGKGASLDAIVPGYFAAFDLAESEDWLNTMVATMVCVLLGGCCWSLGVR